MANKGPDGVNRCGFLRGKKCEEKRYQQDLNGKIKETGLKDLTSGDNTTTIIIILVVVVMAAIGFVMWKRGRK